MHVGYCSVHALRSVSACGRLGCICGRLGRECGRLGRACGILRGACGRFVFVRVRLCCARAIGLCMWDIVLCERFVCARGRWTVRTCIRKGYVGRCSGEGVRGHRCVVTPSRVHRDTSDHVCREGCRV